MQHPAIPAVEAVARSACSSELAAEVGQAASDTVAAAAEEVLILLGLGLVPERVNFQAQALYSLAKQCIGLTDAGLSSEEIGCGLSLSVAEVVANSVAAFAMGLSEAKAQDPGNALALLELLCLDLDILAPQLFGRLSRLASAPAGHPEAPESRVHRALQGICVWTFAALCRAIGLEHVSGGVLWEWASGDAAWALLLAKGVLSLTRDDLCDIQVASSGDPALDAVAVPAELAELRLAALGAVLDLASPKVLFSTTDDITGEAITIQMRNAELVLHRAELAVGAASISGFIGALIGVAQQAGGGVGPQLVSFLAGVLQPELAREPDWVGASPMMKATAHEACRAAAIFASRLEAQAPAMWRLLAETPGALEGRLPPGFLQDCANVAFLSSPSEMDFAPFASAVLSCLTGAGGAAAADASALASLGALAANSGVGPEEEGAALASAMSASIAASPAAVRAGLEQRWSSWRGPPPHASVLRRWEEFADAAAAAAAGEPPPQPRPAPPSEPPPPPPPPAEGPPEQPPQPSKGLVLGNLLRDCPEHYRCQLDKRLMMDPVRCPTGYVFDRAALAAALSHGNGVCPLTGHSLSMDQCERLPALRKEIQVWVRQQRGAGGRAKPELAAAVSRGAAAG